MDDSKLTQRDISEFLEYLYACTDAQVEGVYEKETAAGRLAYAELARHVMRGRRVCGRQ